MISDSFHRFFLRFSLPERNPSCPLELRNCCESVCRTTSCRQSSFHGYRCKPAAAAADTDTDGLSLSRFSGHFWTPSQWNHTEVTPPFATILFGHALSGCGPLFLPSCSPALGVSFSRPIVSGGCWRSPQGCQEKRSSMAKDGAAEIMLPVAPISLIPYFILYFFLLFLFH